MATPQLINALNLSLIERGFLSLDDPEALSGYFLDQIRHYPTVKSIEFANEKGEDVSVARDVFDTPLVLGFSGKNTGGDFRAFETDWSGRLGKLVWELPDFVPKENSWYKTAVEARQPTWTPIYVWPNGDLGIDAVRLVKKDGEPMGVLDTAITLNDVTDFVAKIKKSANGRVYVLDGDGLIVAGSHIPTPYIEEKNSNDEAMVRRMSPDDSSDPLLQKVVSNIKEQLEGISPERQMRFSLNNTTYLSFARPFRDQYGLSWTLISVAPLSDFTSELAKNNMTTLLLITLATIFAIFLSFILAKAITSPLARLLSAVEGFAKENIIPKPIRSRIVEIRALGDAFYKMAIAKRQVDKAKTEFVYLASHQLRTPLTAMNWYSELLGGNIPRKAQLSYASEVRTAVKRMVSLINALLDVSRLEMGTFEGSEEKVDLEKAAKNVLKEVAPLVKAKKLNLKEKYADLQEIKIDPKLLRIIFLNIISNAVKYTPKGGWISLEVSRRSAGDEVGGRVLPKECFLIAIADSGIGIPDDQKAKVFSKFYRAENAKAVDQEGSGLGLYFVKLVTDRLGADIWFSSVEGKGTVFYVSLPLQ